MCINCNIPLPLKRSVARSLGLLPGWSRGAGGDTVTEVPGERFLKSRRSSVSSVGSTVGSVSRVGSVSTVSTVSSVNGVGGSSSRYGKSGKTRKCEAVGRSDAVGPPPPLARRVTALITHNNLRALLAGLPPMAAIALLPAEACPSDALANLDALYDDDFNLARVNFTNVNQFVFVFVGGDAPGGRRETSRGIDFHIGVVRRQGPDAPPPPPARVMPPGFPVAQLCYADEARLARLSARSPHVSHCVLLLRAAGVPQWRIPDILEKAVAAAPGDGIRTLCGTCLSRRRRRVIGGGGGGWNHTLRREIGGGGVTPAGTTRCDV
jgi:hypothetical protein